MRTLPIACLVIVCLFSSLARANVFTVPLTEVTGAYSNDTVTEFSFDLQTALQSVQSVRIDWAGTIEAGLTYWETPHPRCFIVYLDPYAGPYALGALAGEATYPEPEAFQAISAFNPFTYGDQLDWSLLLDGEASGFIRLEGIGELPEYPVRQPGSGTLSSVSLIIEAIPAPEPTTLVLLAIPLAIGVRRRGLRHSVPLLP